MMRSGPVRVVRPVTPGPPWRNPGHALLGAPPLAFGERQKERKTGEPPRPSKATGANEARLFSNNDDEMDPRGRELFSPLASAQAATKGPNARPREQGRGPLAKDERKEAGRRPATPPRAA